MINLSAYMYQVMTTARHSGFMIPVILFAVVSLTCTATAGADTHPVDPSHICAADVGSIGNCTANDIKIADATRAVVTSVKYCLPGDLVIVDEIRVDYQLNALQRYDPLLWVGINGNDPRVESGDDPPPQDCYVSSVPLDSDPEIFQHLDSDACLDVNNTGMTTVDYLPAPSIPCLDNDADGEADFHAIVSWQQNTAQDCGTTEPQYFGLGAPSKCNYSLIPLGIPFNWPTLTIIKHVINDDGGTAVASNWTMDVTVAEPLDNNPTENNFPGLEAPGKTIAIKAGAYSVDESGGPAGYTKTLSPGCSGSLADGESAVCTITNDDDGEVPLPQLTVIKHVINDDGGTAVASNWTMDITATNPSNNNFPGAEAPGVTVTIDAGAYSVDESGGPEGYTKTLSSGCSGNLANGESAICTITNDDNEVLPQLTVIKHVINDDGGTAVASNWTMDITATNPSNNNFPGAEAPGVTVTIDAGAYSVDESGGPEGYTKTLSAGCSGSLADGESAVCTITNDDNEVLPQLTVIKHVINDDGGTAVASNWTMDITATNPSSNNFPGAEAPGVTVTIDAGAYSVDESGGPEGYTKTLSPGCSGNLANGESAVCTITNDDNAVLPQLTVIKHVINDDGGTAVASDWTMDITATNPSNNNFPGAEAPGVTVTIDAGAYSVDESGGPEGYTKTLSAGCSGSLADGESAVCTITNDDNEVLPQLTVIKHVINDDDGTAVASDWTMDVTAINPSSNNFPGAEAPGVTITIDAGVYSVDESGGPEGYIKTLSSGCSGNLANGESAICTIINNDGDSPETQLTVIKHVINDDDGTAVASDWTMDITATNPSNNNFPGAEAPGVTIDIDAGAYSVDESGGPEGYIKTLSSGCSGNLAEGQSVICTITNNDDDIPPPPQLTVIKHVVNDDGGTAVASNWTMDITATNPSSNNFPGAEAPGVTVTIDAGVYSVDESGGPEGYTKTLSSGCSGNLANGQSATCEITNDDNVDNIPPPPPQDLSVTKTLNSTQFGCPIIIGSKAEFSILLEHNGPGPGAAKDVILYDRWSEQFKPSKTPDMYECTQPKPRMLRCKLGNFENGSSRRFEFDFFVNGQPLEEACNTVRVSSSPAETDSTEDNESTVCLTLVNPLTAQPDQLPTASVGVEYDQVISVTGGLQPYQTTVTGLPASGLEYRLNPENTEIRISGCPTNIQTEQPVTVRVNYSGEDFEQACDSLQLEQVYKLSIEDFRGCIFDPLFLGESATATPDSPLPDESVQKVAVDGERNRYVVGFTYLEQNYTEDPNGEFLNPDKNYDIRLMKFDDSEAMIWDKTFDTGNNDYGYAVTLSPDHQRIYVGGGAEVESGPHAWHDAVLLELDAGSGCPVGQYRQSSGPGTTSAYYDIAVDGENIYAVGEVQVNPDKADGSLPAGGLVTVFSKQDKANQESCADNLIIPVPTANNLVLTQSFTREGDAPMVAYSVELVPTGCVECKALVGGATGLNGIGWVDSLDTDNETLTPYKSPVAMGVQDIAVRGEHVVLVGSNIENDMLMLGYDGSGAALWDPNPINIGKGRLRAVKISADGFIYAVATSEDGDSTGHLYKYDLEGNRVVQRQSGSDTDISFHDLALFDTGGGVITGQIETAPFNFGWLTYRFNCDGACDPASN